MLNCNWQLCAQPWPSKTSGAHTRRRRQLWMAAQRQMRRAIALGPHQVYQFRDAHPCKQQTISPQRSTSSTDECSSGSHFNNNAEVPPHKLWTIMVIMLHSFSFLADQQIK
mmetsp:Transcript_17950/g.29359  ORF Transcript_17950/g.29359 Transcript_17950/m.29359 type:complete len:111 (+) Transcript_17950:305-637(+)